MYNSIVVPIDYYASDNTLAQQFEDLNGEIRIFMILLTLPCSNEADYHVIHSLPIRG